MRVRKIDTEQKRDVQQFVGFPFQLYRDCPQWVPPWISSVKNNLNRHQNPFYRHSMADFFLAESEGQTLGRVAAIHNRRYNEYHGAKTAFFGYFDVVEDVEAAHALFDAVADWARAQGLDEILGPRGIMGSDTGGVLVEGFEHRAAMGVPYNFPYYDGFIRDSGFEKDTDYLSGYLGGDYQLPERLHRIAERAKARRGFWVKTFESKREMRQWAPRVVEAHHEAFSQNHTFYPPSAEEIAIIMDLIITIADRRLIKLVMKDERIVGFVFAYPDLSAGLQKAKGRLWPFGWFYILRERKRTRWVNINGLGVLPAHRGLGSNAILYTELEKALRACDFEHADLIQAEEGNYKSLADMEALGVKWYKRHRGYRRTLENSHA